MDYCYHSIYAHEDFQAVEWRCRFISLINFRCSFKLVSLRFFFKLNKVCVLRQLYTWISFTKLSFSILDFDWLIQEKFLEFWWSYHLGASIGADERLKIYEDLTNLQLEFSFVKFTWTSLINLVLFDWKHEKIRRKLLMSLRSILFDMYCITTNDDDLVFIVF